LLPWVEEAVFDRHLARLDRVARFISSAEAAESSDVNSYDDAAWEAGLDLSDFPAAAEQWSGGDAYLDAETFRAAVIEYWDLELRREVADLFAAADAWTYSGPGDAAGFRAG
jgi:hypothetical protein